MACGQTDAKRLVAYTSVAHMSIVLMGVSGGVHFALMGAAVEMVGHAFSASALFFLIGAVYDRVGTRDLRELGGLQRTAPRFAALFALFFSAVLAMPGTANFLGEALVITGMFQVNWIYAAIVLTALVVSVVYATRLLKEIVFGEPGPKPVTIDLGTRELALMVLLGTCTIWFGLLPQLLMTPFTPAVECGAGVAGRRPAMTTARPAARRSLALAAVAPCCSPRAGRPMRRASLPPPALRWRHSPCSGAAGECPGTDAAAARR